VFFGPRQVFFGVSPDDVVGRAELGNSKFFWAKLGGQGSVGDFVPQSFNGVGEDFSVVKGQFDAFVGYFDNWYVFGVFGVAAALGFGKIVLCGKIGHAYHAHAGVTTCIAVGAELFKVPNFVGDSGFFSELSPCGTFEVFFLVYKASREGPGVAKGVFITLNKQYPEGFVNNAEYQEVYRYGEIWVVAGVVRGVCHTARVHGICQKCKN
jgi:hypothetical protein